MQVSCILCAEKKTEVAFPRAEELLQGNPAEINHQLNMDEQIDLLPYDKRWEFPRHRLKLGSTELLNNFCHVCFVVYNSFKIYIFPTRRNTIGYRLFWKSSQS